MQIVKHPFKILFVEDEKSIRDNYIKYLNEYYEYVYEAEDGEEAYRIYQEKKPEILIIDINIPKLNGIELLKKIRENDHTTKAIMLTAHTDVNMMREAAGLKLTEYLIKPVTRSALKSTLNKVVSELSQFKVVPIKKFSLTNNYFWDVDNQELTHHSKSIILTKKEKKVLLFLLSTANRTFTSEEIIFAIWENDDEGNNNALKQIIKNLRLKLPQGIIKNVFGVGYRVVI
jgi:DNA-binding response OmpR family regulator